MKILRGILIGLFVVAVLLCALPFVLLRVATTHKVSNDLLHELVPLYVDADAQIGTIDYSLFKSWPNIDVQLHDLLVLSDALQPTDTLLYIPQLALTVDARTYLYENTVNVWCTIDDPLVKAVQGCEKANWEITRPSEPDTGSTVLPDIYLHQLQINRARLRYLDSTDFKCASIDSLSLKADGAYLADSVYAKLQLLLGRFLYDDPSIDRHYNIREFALKADALQNQQLVDIELEAGTDLVCLDDSLLGIRERSLDIRLDAYSNHSFDSLCIRDFAAKLDSIRLTAEGLVDLRDSSAIDMDLRARLDIPSISDLLSLVPKPFAHHTKGAVFDGSIQLDADAKGRYQDKRYPVVNAHLQVEDLHGHFENYSQSIDELDIDAYGCYNQGDINRTYGQVKRLYFKSTDSHLRASGRADYRNRRPYLDATLNGHLNLGSLNRLYEIKPGMKLQGVLDADLKAYFFVDDLQEKRFDKIFSKGSISGDDLLVHLPDDSLRLFVDSLSSRINTNTGMVSRRSAGDTALVNVRVRFQEMDLQYKHLIQANSSRFTLSLMADDVDADSPPKLRGSVSMRGLRGTALDSLMLNASRMRATLSVAPDEEHAFLPNTSLRLSFDSIRMASKQMGILLDSTRLHMSALPHFRRTKRVNGQRVSIPDSLQPVRNLKWMIDTLQTLSKSDSLVDHYMKLFRNKGDIYVKSFRSRSQDFPLPISVRRMDLKFSDDTLQLNNLRVRVGRSSAGLTGNVYNMRRWAMSSGRPISARMAQDPDRLKRIKALRTLTADLKLTSRRIDANQLVNALYEMNQADPQDSAQEAAQHNFDLLSEQVPEEDQNASTASDSLVEASLIRIPDYLDLHFGAQADSIYLSRMQLTNFRGDVHVRDHTLRIKQLTTATEVGDAQVNLMYHCDNPKEANAAIAVNLDSVQIGELVDALPELDSIMPMLRSFKGSAECEVSATARIDSSMSVILPSVNAAAWLQGKDLVLLDGETFSEIAKMLMFSKKTENVIDSIAVELLVRNNEIEIFPFVVSLDKYRVGVGGNQALDMSFNYHIAVLKSPLPFMLGVDVYGTDFDHIKFKLVSPRFKDTNVKIGRGGTLLRKEDANLRENFHRMIVNKILKD